MEAYEAACRNRNVTAADFTRTMVNASQQAKDYTVHIRNGTGSAEEYKASQQAIQNSLYGTLDASKAASFGVKALSVAFNSFLGMAIMWGLGKLIEGINFLLQTSEHAIEKSKELRQEFSNNSSDYASKRQTLESIREEYNALSRYVNVNGEAIGLSASEYKRYQDIVSQILDITPQLITGWDKEGRAISTKNDLLQSSIDLLDEEYQKELRNATTPANNRQVAAGIIEEVEDFKKGAATEPHSDAATKLHQNFVNRLFSLAYSGIDLNHYEIATQVYDYVYPDGDGLESSTGLINFIDTVNQHIRDNNDTDKLAKILIDKFHPIHQLFSFDISEELQKDARNYMDEFWPYQSQLESLYQGYKDQINRSVQVIDGYVDLSATSKTVISEYVNGLAYENIEKPEDFLKFVEDTKNFTKSFISYSALSEQVNNLFTLSEKELPMEEYLDQYRALLLKIESVCEKLNIKFPSIFSDDIDELEKKYQGTIMKFGEDGKLILQNYFKDHSINSNSEIEYWQELTKEARNAEEAIQMYHEQTKAKFLNIPDTINQLNTHLKPALDSIQSAYQDIFTENGMELDNLDLSSLTSIRSAMEDIEIDSSSFNDFLEVLIDIESTEQDVQKAFDHLVDTITHTSLSGLEDFDTLRFSLKSMGIENSEIVAFKALINNTEALAEANFDLKNVTKESAEAFVDETVSAENMAEAMKLLTLRTILYNATNLDSTQDINALYQLAEATGIATDSVFHLLHMKSVYTDAVESGNTAAAIAAQHRINSLRQDVENQFAHLGKTDWNGNSGSSSTSPSSTADTYLEAFEKELEELDRLKSENKLSEKQYLDALRRLYLRYFQDKEKYLKEYSKYEYQYLDGMKSLYESAFSYITKQIDQRIDAVTKEKEAAIESLEAQKEAAAQTIQTQIDSIDEQIDHLDQLIEKKQEEIDAIQKAADARQREIDLQKAQYELERMQHQRTTLVYREGQGLVYEADTTGIREAREQVEDAKREIHIAAIETEIDGLEKQQDALNDQRELLERLLEKSNEYYDGLIGQTEERFDTLISSLEDYQNQFDELAELEENTRQENSLLELGIHLEDILAGSQEAFVQLINAYLDIVKQIYQENPSMLEQLDKLSQQVSQAGSIHLQTAAQEAAFAPDLSDTKSITALTTGTAAIAETAPDFSHLRELQPGDRMYELLQKAEAYFSRTDSRNSPFSSTVDRMAETIEKATMVHLPAEGIRQPVTVNFGDIHLHEVQNVDTFADELCMRLPNLMLQKTRSLY